MTILAGSDHVSDGAPAYLGGALNAEFDALRPLLNAVQTAAGYKAEATA